MLFPSKDNRAIKITTRKTFIAAISQIEHDKHTPSLELLKAMANVLNVGLEDIVAG